MRWRLQDIPADVRKTARDAARAAGLPLGAWLERAVLSAEGRAAEATPLSEVKSDNEATHPIEPDEGGGRVETPEISPTHSRRQNAEDDAAEHGADDWNSNAEIKTARPAPTELRGVARLFAGRRAKSALAVAAIMAIVIVGVGAWWHFSSPSRDAQQLAGSASSSSTRVEPGVSPSQAPQSPSLNEVMEELRRDAENGDAMSQHDLALAYLNGRGVTQNYQTAAEWFDKAALAGLERAQFNLAVLYENALGVPEDVQRAFQLYSAAAEQGFAPAQHNLAVAYAQGRGTSRDYQAAALWFRRAAEQGVASAQFNLGMIYERGLAGPPDEQTAYGWYRRAAASGSEAAVARLAAIEGRIASTPAETEHGPRAAKPTGAEIAEMQRLLSLLSFNPGPADGKPGKATREAIRQYQRLAALPVNGEPSKELLAHLRQVTNMMRSGGR